MRISTKTICTCTRYLSIETNKIYQIRRARQFLMHFRGIDSTILAQHSINLPFIRDKQFAAASENVPTTFVVLFYFLFGLHTITIALCNSNGGCMHACMRVVFRSYYICPIVPSNRLFFFPHSAVV